MNPFTEGVRQHDTHNPLAAHRWPRNAPFKHLDLDAIIVPGIRSAPNLDHAVTLARAAGCWLLILCSHRLRGPDVEQLLADRSYDDKAIVIDLPRGYSHKLLYFPGISAVRDELPPECSFFAPDLSMKRNIGLVLARMLGWHRIFFLDDDIRDISYLDMQHTVDMLGSFSAAGMWVTSFPDNSIVCHANRMTGGSQDVFVSGAALAVDCDADIGFFPDIYNEDWLFFFDDLSKGQLANSGLEITQLRYDPFANARQAAWQEFGDVLAEGLYALLHLGLDVRQATSKYWTCFLEARRNFLEAIITRSQNAPADIRDDMLQSVQRALKCLLMIKPGLCERYVRAWRQDLDDWKRRAAAVPQQGSIEAALTEMRLLPAASPRSTRRVPPRRGEAAATVHAGPVAIPQFETLKQMSAPSSVLQFTSVAPADVKKKTIPFPAVTDEHEAAVAEAAGSHIPSSAPEVRGWRRKPRHSGSASWLGSISDARWAIAPDVGRVRRLLTRTGGRGDG